MIYGQRFTSYEPNKDSLRHIFSENWVEKVLALPPSDLLKLTLLYDKISIFSIGVIICYKDARIYDRETACIHGMCTTGKNSLS